MSLINSELFEFEVDESLHLKRLDQILSSHPRVESRSQAVKIIHESLVQVRMSTSQVFVTAKKTATLLQSGTTIRFSIQHSVKSKIVAIQQSIEIRFEDEDIIVVNKPAGLVVHPGAGNLDHTLVHGLIERFPDLAEKFDDDRPGIVHRLDKETSGLLVIARHPEAKEHLISQFKNRKVHRRYQAVVFGNLKNEHGRIDSYLTRHLKYRTRFISIQPAENEPLKGKRAITNYRVVATQSDQFSLVELKLETGRTHQIRVHLTHLGHPLLGDNAYRARNKRKSTTNEKFWMNETGGRVALHAMELGFQHPRNQEWVSFCEEWPINTRGFFERLNWSEMAKCTS